MTTDNENPKEMKIKKVKKVKKSEANDDAVEPTKKKKKMKLVKKVKKPKADAPTDEVVGEPVVEVEPEKKKKKIKDVKKVKKPKADAPTDEVVGEPVVEVEPEKKKKKIKDVKKVKKPKVVDENPNADVEVEVVEPVDEKKKKTNTEEPISDVVDIEGLANVEINADVQSVIDETDVPEVTDVAAPPALRIDVTVIESEYVDIIKNVTEMSKALQATMSQLNSLYKKTIEALGQVEQRRPDEVVPPSDLVDMDTQKTLTDEFGTFSGKKTMSKMEAMKFVQDYVVKRDLHSDDEKRLVTCDEVLTALFKKESFTYFELSGIVDQHLL
jgi:chromatin remodeling complex protein RSC6